MLKLERWKMCDCLRKLFIQILMEKVKIARYVYRVISKIGGVKETLLLFQACSCLIFLVVNPPSVITCRHMLMQDIINPKHALEMQDTKLSREMNENLCTYKYNDTLWNKLLFFLIGFTVIIFIQVKKSISVSCLQQRTSIVNLLNCVLTSYALIGLSKYFIFPQLNSILYGCTSVLHLLISPVKLVMSCILVLLGLPLSLFYRLSQNHLIEIPKHTFVDLIFSMETDTHRTMLDAIPDEALSLDCSKVCWSVFKWSNLFLLTLHIIACALLINSEDKDDEKKGLTLSNDEICKPIIVDNITNDVCGSSVLKTLDFQCKTCLNQKNSDKLPTSPPLDGVSIDIRNKFATKPVNITKPLNISPTLRKKRLKVEKSTQTENKNTSMSLEKQKIKLDQLVEESSMENSIYASTDINCLLMTIATQTNIKAINKVTQTNEILSQINMIDKENQSEFDSNVIKPEILNKSIQVNNLNLNEYKTSGTSTVTIPISTTTQMLTENVDNSSLSENQTNVNKNGENNKMTSYEDKLNETKTTVMTNAKKSYEEKCIQTVDKTHSNIATSTDFHQEEKSVQTSTSTSSDIHHGEKSVQTTSTCIYQEEKSVQTSTSGDIQHDVKSVQTTSTCIYQEEKSVQTTSSGIHHDEKSVQATYTGYHHEAKSVQTTSTDFQQEQKSVQTTSTEINKEEKSVQTTSTDFHEEDISVQTTDINKYIEITECIDATTQVDDAKTYRSIGITTSFHLTEKSIQSTPPVLTVNQGIQFTSKCDCVKDSNKMSKRTQTSIPVLEKSVQVYSLRAERRDNKPIAVFDDEILYSSRDALYFDSEDKESSRSTSPILKSFTSIGTNTVTPVSEKSAQTTAIKEVKVSTTNMDIDCQRAYFFDEKELKELEFREIENVYKTIDKKSHIPKSNKSTQIDFLKVRESLNNIQSCNCQKENIGKTVYSLMTLDEQIFSLSEPIKFKAKKSFHGIWYVCLRGDVFLSVCQEVLMNIKLLSEIENIERYIEDDILKTMKAFVDNYTRLSVCFDDDEDESDDESFINGFRL